jgi:hypothetical protein
MALAVACTMLGIACEYVSRVIAVVAWPRGVALLATALYGSLGEPVFLLD